MFVNSHVQMHHILIFECREIECLRAVFVGTHDSLDRSTLVYLLQNIDPRLWWPGFEVAFRKMGAGRSGDDGSRGRQGPTDIA